MPSRLLLKLAGRLFADVEERERFVAALEMKREHAPCVIWTDPGRDPADFDLPRAPESPGWLPEGVLRLAPGTQPGKHPWHGEGAFYCLDFSSVFAASAMLVAGPGRRVLDVCAAPGGKSIFAGRLLAPELLVANEVIGKRLAILRSNLGRCRIPRAFTQRLDPAEWGERGRRAFDLVLVDAPCSGQSLLAKGMENPGCFHPTTVQGNARRQRRILAASAEAVAAGGWLLYSTCTFAPEENEKVVQWFLARGGEEWEAMPVPHLEPWRSPLAGFPGYRLHPHSGWGAGAFVAVLRRGGSEGRLELPGALLAYPVGA